MGIKLESVFTLNRELTAARENKPREMFILIVDDVELNRGILSAVIEETGAFVDCAVNGADAVDKFSGKNGAYDLLLMDIHMPEMDGFEASRRIRAIEAERFRSGQHVPHVPIVAISADTGAEVRTKCIEAGMDDYIEKPVDFLFLTRIINRYLPNSKKAEAVQA
jgi:CheY-like chemotaxis protein